MKVSVMTSLGGWALCAILWVAPACKRTEAPPTVQGAPAGEQSASTQGTPAIPFELRADSTDVTLFWFDQWGNAHAVTRASEVPEANRERVRVDPVRPELRAAGWVFVADLRAPAADGRFTVRAVQSEAFAAELNPALAARTQQASPSGASAPANQKPEVVLYGASWCGACNQAKQWMRQQNIPFVEHDIEREPQAAQELTSRAREQGVPTGSIPIISVRGRLMVGFDPGTLNRALGRSS
jgi:glutaredoxin